MTTKTIAVAVVEGDLVSCMTCAVGLSPPQLGAALALVAMATTLIVACQLAQGIVMIQQMFFLRFPVGLFTTSSFSATWILLACDIRF